MDPNKLYIRRLEKMNKNQKKIIELCYDHRYTTVEIISEFLGIRITSVYRIITQLENLKLIKKHKIILVKNTIELTVVGITLEGIYQHARNSNEAKIIESRAFDKSTFNNASFLHTLAIQKVRNKIDKMYPESQFTFTPIPRRKRNKQIPDMVWNPKRDVFVAVEVELTVKTKQRYQDILCLYANDLECWRYKSVIYAIPKLKIKQFRKVIEEQQYVMIKKYKKESLRDRIKFVSF